MPLFRRKKQRVRLDDLLVFNSIVPADPEPPGDHKPQELRIIVEIRVTGDAEVKLAVQDD